LLLTAVADQIALTVSFQIQPVDPTAATRGLSCVLSSTPHASDLA
jgi:hypothetical protein